MYEDLGYALLRASMQSESMDEFLSRIAESIASSEKSVELYVKLGEKAKETRCRGQLAYVKYWRAQEASEKKKWARESWDFTERALGELEAAKEQREFLKTSSRLLSSAIFSLSYESDHSVQDPIVTRLLNYSENAIQYSSSLEGPDDLARAYVTAACWLDWASAIPTEPKEQEIFLSRAQGYWEKAVEISEEAAYLQFVASGPNFAFFGTGSDQAFTEFGKILGYARKSGDRLLVGSALEGVAFHEAWKSRGVEDPMEQADLLERSFRNAQKAKDQFAPIRFASVASTVMWSQEPVPYYFYELSRLEFDPVRKKALLEKANENAPRLIKMADDLEMTYVIGTTRHLVSKILEGLAGLEVSPERRRELLKTALDYREETIRIQELGNPHYYWDLGVFRNYLANIKYELSKIETNADNKKRLLDESVSAKKMCLEDWAKAMPMIEKSPASIETLGERYLQYGDMLSTAASSVNKSSGQLESAAEAFERAVDLFKKSGIVSRAAESYWRLGQNRDSVNDHLRAARAFQNAAEDFHLASERILQLRELYIGQSAYMEAWNNIEMARHHHAKQEYDLAAKSYEKAAALHKSTSHWDYLAPNYSAWAEVEFAEDLSRKDQADQAILGFQKAETLFRVGRNTLSHRSAQLMSVDEKEMVSKLVSAAAAREDYCKSRIILEEAKTLDKAGEHNASAEKYGQAVIALEKLISQLRIDEPPTEFRLILALSRAWQKLSMAEAEASPELYLEAAGLFEEAKQFSPTEKSKMLALGHSRFCKALEAGARFSDTRDRNFHEKAVQQLESAANYYVKAGFDYASEYVKACKLLFDGYVYMDEANKERDHEKKTRLYAMAEKVLEGSADSYQKSHYPGKRDEVLALLKKVREDREIAGSLSNILYGPRVMSSTASFNMPTPTFEKAVGLEMFEHAAVQASLIVKSREVKVGEDIDMEIELVNAGRGTAQLIKLEQIVPEGFSVTSQSEQFRLEDSFVNLKGRQLSPLKTEEVRLVAKSKTRGRFTVRPRILYLDETGSYKSYEPDPVEINVKELGLSGWVKGR